MTSFTTLVLQLSALSMIGYLDFDILFVIRHLDLVITHIFMVNKQMRNISYLNELSSIFRERFYSF